MVLFRDNLNGKGRQVNKKLEHVCKVTFHTSVMIISDLDIIAIRHIKIKKAFNPFYH